MFAGSLSSRGARPLVAKTGGSRSTVLPDVVMPPYRLGHRFGGGPFFVVSAGAVAEGVRCVQKSVDVSGRGSHVSADGAARRQAEGWVRGPTQGRRCARPKGPVIGGGCREQAENRAETVGAGKKGRGRACMSRP